MSLYTVRGSAELDARIRADMKQIAEVTAPHSLAGVLIGGYGRGEGTPFIKPNGSQEPFNDYDLVVVVDRLTGKVRETFRRLERELSGKVGLPVDLCPYHAAHLRRCAFSLLNYEMKYGHRVIWGADDILAALPAYPHDGIPLPEGTRLLLNRGKLLLDMQRRLTDPAPLSGEERIRFIKFIHKVLLAFGDCALLAAGQYDISYAVKKMRFTAIGHCPERDYIVEGYRRAIDLKNWGDFESMARLDIAAEVEILRKVYLKFMPWYRTQHHGSEGTPLKNIILNLKWNRRLSAHHPREALYDLITELLKNGAPSSIDRFYRLQQRFS
jgi:hypothetical protein